MQIENLGRAGANLAYDEGYKDGVQATLSLINGWLDEDTLNSVREDLLGDSNED